MDRGDFDEATRDLDQAAAVAQALQVDSLIGLVARVRGRLHRLMGDTVAASEALSQAEAVTSEIYELARVHLERGLLGEADSAERLAQAEALLGDGTFPRSVSRALAELRAQVAERG
jgi:hypothetical protein